MSLSSRELFRKGAAGIVTAGLLATSALGFGSARAETVLAAATPKTEKVTPSTDCRNYITAKEILGDVKCEIIKGKLLDARGKELDAQGKALDQELKNKLRVNACLAQILIFKKDKPDVFATFGKITSENACEIAAQLPQKNAARVIPPSSAALN